MASPLSARREAALRLPPLADGRRDPLFERERRPHDSDSCHICGGKPELGALVWLFGAWMCRDRVECYQRFRRALKGKTA